MQRTECTQFYIILSIDNMRAASRMEGGEMQESASEMTAVANLFSLMASYFMYLSRAYAVYFQLILACFLSGIR